MNNIERRRGAALLTTRLGHATRRRAGSLLAAIAIVAVATTGAVVGAPAQPAFAAEYPSWGDVQSARKSESSKRAEITRIRDLLAQLEDDVADTQAEAVDRGEELRDAQQAFDEADFKANQLQNDADEAREKADESKLRAGQLAARLARSGGDVSASLFFDSGSADDLLSQLGMASKITDQSAGIYDKATVDENAAQSLTDQAEVAKAALGDLADAAADALEAAQAAAETASVALEEEQENRAQLQAQLEVLVEDREATEEDFEAGERAREAEARRVAAAQAAAARAAAEAAAAAAAAAGGGGGGGGSSGGGSSGGGGGGGGSAAPAPAPGGQVGSSGWARPSGGGIVSSYGYRLHPIYHDYRLHAGSDFGAGCGWPIYAAQSGTVVYSGPNGGYGNFISIASGGVTTGYAHIQNGGLLVGGGQQVTAGQLIALTGTTGSSTGCHLHFEVRVNGSTVDPVPFLRSKGVGI